MSRPAPLRGRNFGAFGSVNNFHHFRRNPFFFNPYYGFPYGYGYIPSFSELPLFGYGDDYFGQESEQDNGSYAAPEQGQDQALYGQVERLSNEVEAMREDQAGGGYQRPVSASPAIERKPVATVLVYRDGHQSDVLNYAVQGKTLWVFSDQAPRKIPLESLDLEATRKVNDQRGVSFILPDSP